jgi:hypothetical protein
MRLGLLLSVLSLSLACGPEPEPRPSERGGADAGVDSGVIAAPDAAAEDAAEMDAESIDAAAEDASVMDTGGTTGPQPTWTVVRAVLVRVCGRCHDGVPAGFDVRERGDLVGGRSSVSWSLIEAGDPERSFLYRKIAHTHAAVCTELGVPTRNCGQGMPLMAARLSDATLEAIREWIANGAVED